MTGKKWLRVTWQHLRGKLRLERHARGRKRFFRVVERRAEEILEFHQFQKESETMSRHSSETEDKIEVLRRNEENEACSQLHTDTEQKQGENNSILHTAGLNSSTKDGLSFLVHRTDHCLAAISLSDVETTGQHKYVASTPASDLCGGSPRLRHDSRLGRTALYCCPPVPPPAVLLLPQSGQ